MSAIVRPGRYPADQRGGGPLIWTTAEGEKLPITQMHTGHLFNAMKLLFNHLAEMWGGTPVWHHHRYSDYVNGAISGRDHLAMQVVAMVAELDRRSDMPDHYKAPYAAIVGQIFPERAALGDGR